MNITNIYTCTKNMQNMNFLMEKDVQEFMG